MPRHWKLNHKADWLPCVADLLTHPALQAMDGGHHWTGYPLFQHCLLLSYTSYTLSRRLGLRAQDAARGGLLRGLPVEVLKNQFLLTRREADIAGRPALWPPRCREGWASALAGVLCAALELARLAPQEIPVPHPLLEQPCGPGLLQVL